jgi:hypothetical protein
MAAGLIALAMLMAGWGIRELMYRINRRRKRSR